MSTAHGIHIGDAVLMEEKISNGATRNVPLTVIGIDGDDIFAKEIGKDSFVNLLKKDYGGLCKSK